MIHDHESRPCNVIFSAKNSQGRVFKNDLNKCHRHDTDIGDHFYILPVCPLERTEIQVLLIVLIKVIIAC